jgi:hypothetical protein
LCIVGFVVVARLGQGKVVCYVALRRLWSRIGGKASQVHLLSRASRARFHKADSGRGSCFEVGVEVPLSDRPWTVVGLEFLLLFVLPISLVVSPCCSLHMGSLLGHSFGLLSR